VPPRAREAERQEKVVHRQQVHKAFADPMRLVHSVLRSEGGETGRHPLHSTGRNPAPGPPAPPTAPSHPRRKDSTPAADSSDSGSTSNESAGSRVSNKRRKKHDDKMDDAPQKKKQKKHGKSLAKVQRKEKEALIARLRQERLQREYAERHRAQQLLHSLYP